MFVRECLASALSETPQYTEVFENKIFYFLWALGEVLGLLEGRQKEGGLPFFKSSNLGPQMHQGPETLSRLRKCGVLLDSHISPDHRNFRRGRPGQLWDFRILEFWLGPNLAPQFEDCEWICSHLTLSAVCFELLCLSESV